MQVPALYMPVTDVTEEQIDAIYNIHYKGRILPHAEIAAIYERWWWHY